MKKRKRLTKKQLKEKCKAGPCMHPKTHPFENPKYCEKHFKTPPPPPANKKARLAERRRAYLDKLEANDSNDIEIDPPSLWQRIKAFIFVDP